MKKFFTIFFASILTIAMIGAFSCKKPKPCEENHTGNVIFWNSGPSYVYPTMGIEVDWSDGNSDLVTFSSSYTFYDAPVGRANVYCVWEDDYYYYYSSGYIMIKQCQLVQGYLTLGKSAKITEDYVTLCENQANKKDYGSMNDFLKSIKQK
jgi:hypothetical protein